MGNVTVPVAQCRLGGGWGCREWELVRLRLPQIMHVVTRETGGVAPQKPITTQFKSACTQWRMGKRSASATVARYSKRNTTAAPEMQLLEIEK